MIRSCLREVRVVITVLPLVFVLFCLVFVWSGPVLSLLYLSLSYSRACLWVVCALVSVSAVMGRVSIPKYVVCVSLVRQHFLKGRKKKVER